MKNQAEWEWIDVSVPIFDRMVHWPGDPPVEVKQPLHLDRGDPATVSLLKLGTHSGTHVDAPNHFLRGESGVDAIPFEAMCGMARVIDLPGIREITASDLTDQKISEYERILFRTLNSSRAWRTNEFFQDFVHLSVDAAEFLANKKIQAIGVDYLSVGKGESGPLVHQTLLKSGICVIEGLNLEKVPSGSYEMICLPLRVRDGDGAPARVVLKKVGRTG